MKPRTERLEVRLGKEEKELLFKAAEMKGMYTAEFIRTVAVAMAEVVVNGGRPLEMERAIVTLAGKLMPEVLVDFTSPEPEEDYENE